jgi:hypothetical protein
MGWSTLSGARWFGPGVVEEAVRSQSAPLLRLQASIHLWPSAQDAPLFRAKTTADKYQYTLAAGAPHESNGHQSNPSELQR